MKSRDMTGNVIYRASLHKILTPWQKFSNTLRFDPYLRINCGWPHQQDVEQGLRRLG